MNTYKTKSIRHIRTNFRRGNKPESPGCVSNSNLVVIFGVILPPKKKSINEEIGTKESVTSNKNKGKFIRKINK